jgi:HEAT repeat protein
VLAASFDARGPRPAVPAGLVDGLFALLNQSNETEQLAAMDALGLIREVSAVSALTERYYFYRNGGKRALAGGALEALARIGDPSSVDVVKQLLGDKFAEGNDATMLVVWFARERLLKDGSISVLREAADGRRLRSQARGYLEELGAPVP